MPDELQPITIVAPLCSVFRRHLKSEGLKYTPERAQVLETIIGLEGPFEAEHLLEELKQGGHRVSKATVYRTIKLLQEAGIVQRILLEQDHALYQLVYGKGAGDLLVRIDGTGAEPINDPRLEALCRELCAAQGLRYESHRLQVFATGA